MKVLKVENNRDGTECLTARALLAQLNNDFTAAENYYIENNDVDAAIDMYVKVNKWEDAIRLTERMVSKPRVYH